MHRPGGQTEGMSDQVKKKGVIGAFCGQAKFKIAYKYKES